MSRLLKNLLRSASHIGAQETDVTSQEAKLVVAHFMVGNTAPYTSADWDEDVKLASSHGIDGFALNVGREDWQLNQVSECFKAAERSGAEFKLFFSFDMSSLGSSTLQDMNLLKTYISGFALHTQYLHYKGKAIVSTFAGENSLFGCADLNSAWALVKKTLEETCPVRFIIKFEDAKSRWPDKFCSMTCLDGAFNWNGCWPIDLTLDSPKEEIRDPKLLSDMDYLRNLRDEHGARKAYMASVSPWFFTHYGKDSWNKNWIYSCDDWLLARRWQQLIDMRDEVDILQIISWNDYGESHYIGPIKGAQPNSEAWVNGFDHTAWLHLCESFAQEFKAGPRHQTSLSVKMDRVYVWARTHPRDAEAGADPVGRPMNWQLVEDVFWVVIIASAPADVFLWSTQGEAGSSQSYHDATAPQGSEAVSKYNISQGLSTLSCPLVAGGGIHIQVVRNGETVLDFHPCGFMFNACPRTYNFNAYVAMSPPEK